MCVPRVVYSIVYAYIQRFRAVFSLHREALEVGPTQTTCLPLKSRRTVERRLNSDGTPEIFDHTCMSDDPAKIALKMNTIQSTSFVFASIPRKSKHTTQE